MSASVSASKSKMPAKKTTEVAAAPAAAPVAEKKSRKAAPAAAPVVVEKKDEVVVPTTPAVERSSADILSGLQESLRSISTDVTSRLRAVIHDAQEAVKALKREARDSKRRRRVDPETLSPEERKVWEERRAKNAFLKLRPISDELAVFMGIPAKSKKSQTDVTRFLANYIKTHNCFDPNFKRRIVPDAKLAKLLRTTDADNVTYLNLQKFLKVHFLKTA